VGGPFFAVVIPVHNRPGELARAVDSVLAQTCRDFELVVVDDGSTDATSEVAASYGDRIRLIRQENAGVSAARNRGIAATRAPWIALLDSDDAWRPDKLARQRRFAEERPDCSILQANEIWVRNGRRVNPPETHRKRDGRIFRESLARCMVSPSAVALRRDLFERYGPFDERLPACEDYDLWLRITAFEPVGLIDEDLLTRYGGHDDQLSRRFWGMDRFRVHAIVRLLEEYGERLGPGDREAAIAAALERCALLAAGAARRGNAAFAARMDALGGEIRSGRYSTAACGFLVEA